MALLIRGRSVPSSWIPLVGMLLAGGGCMLLSESSPGEKPFAFNHAIHVQQGLECTDCHAGADSRDEPGMPVLAQCQLCHQDLDKEKPPEKHATVLFEGKVFKAQHAMQLGDEVIFSHQAHVARGQECSACHTGIEASERIGPEIRMSMDGCTACHAKSATATKAPEDCAVCHKEIRRDREPTSHLHAWTRMHGQVVRAGSEELGDRCSLCHTESTCTNCHASTPPENHDNFWRIRGHGIAAEVDRTNCAVCHRPDSCERCHADAMPLNHTGMWGTPRDTHCTACHFPLQSNGCVACHKGTPSHALATPMPPTHTPGMNCRQCHGVTQPLPHVDNGSTCTMCHH
jgi:hypothetical protein